MRVGGVVNMLVGGVGCARGAEPAARACACLSCTPRRVAPSAAASRSSLEARMRRSCLRRDTHAAQHDRPGCHM